MKLLRIALLCLMLCVARNVLAQDTVQHRHTVYLRIPTAPVTHLFKSHKANYKYYVGPYHLFDPLRISYGYTTKKVGEWLGHFEYNYRRGEIGNYTYREKGNYRLALIPEKRWFLFPKRMIRPFVGICLPLALIHIDPYIDLLNPDKIGVSPPFTNLAISFGATVGLRVKYKRWNGVLYLQVQNGVWGKNYRKEDFFHYNAVPGFYFENGFQLGYSF